MQAYFLPEHIHFCSWSDAFIFLDLKNDEYLLINERSAVFALQSLILSHGSKELDAASRKSLRELVDSGLLITNGQAGKPLAPTDITIAEVPLVHQPHTQCAEIRLLHVWRALVACAKASTWLRFGRLETAVRRVQQRKSRCRSTAPFDYDRARTATATFFRIRAFFPRNYLCLFDSLALLLYLAECDVYPTWVFGVQLEPWGAHCWVQEGTYIFNEGPEEASDYAVIMAI